MSSNTKITVTVRIEKRNGRRDEAVNAHYDGEAFQVVELIQKAGKQAVGMAVASGLR